MIKQVLNKLKQVKIESINKTMLWINLPNMIIIFILKKKILLWKNYKI